MIEIDGEMYYTGEEMDKILKEYALEQAEILRQELKEEKYAQI